ncbi:Zn-dependent protease [Marinomonas piezotolerans]|uniref:Zn-dependent protease n=1 Tax=Marinomonas piezotolerans TaxID=2213058 RepID=A0A370UCA9_9GAMM|nr:zinc metallopeptidase [Marinomonas piezotolerans]RDL45414.1 Zn-dependent protease [Marinomonas piezotolerans]
MIYVLLIVIVAALFFGPQIWVKRILKRYQAPRPDLPGTGGEFARHLIKRYELDDVTVEEAPEGKDHYDILAKKVRLSPYVLNEQSLTAVAVAAHEVGHAIAHHRQETVARLRTRYLPLAIMMQRLAVIMLFAWPILSAVLRLPYTPILHAVVIGTLGILTVFIQLAILPEEWDASFNKALPILKKGRYLAKQDLPKVRKILIACAMTYVASALMNILLFWRVPRR